MDAFWGAFGGGLAAGIVVLLIEQIRHLRSRPHLKVSGTARFVTRVGAPDELQDLNEKLALQAFNERHLPVAIYGIGLELHHPSRVSKWLSRLRGRSGLGVAETDIAFLDFIPREIKPGQKFDHLVDIEDVVANLREMGKNPEDLKSRCVRFSAGASSFRGALDEHGSTRLKEEFLKAP